MGKTTMKTWLVATLAAVMTAALLAPAVSEAKRLGGGKSTGMQRNMPAQQSPQTPPSQPATPAPATPSPSPAVSPAAAGAAAAAAPAKRSWLGPIAGLAAGLGIAALLSHFGLGEAFANFVMLALLAIAAFFLIRFVLRRMAGPPSPAGLVPAGAAGGAAHGPGAAPRAPAPAFEPVQRRAEPSMPATPSVQAGSSVSTPVGDVSVTGRPLPPIGALAATPVAGNSAAPGPQLPPGFDLPAFERIAKMIFIRMQAANDAGDLDDLRQFTTPEMFAAVRLELQERAGHRQHTDVEQVDAQVIDHAEESGRQIVSVRFHGLVREEPGAPATPFDEIWHLVKPVDDSRPWAIAGIQQPQ
jgi:predicted lipid-binding transport protein (Tim44 family)